MEREHVLRVVAAPGAFEMKKRFSFCQKSSEEWYLMYLRRIVHSILRLWSHRQQEKGLGKLYRLNANMGQALSRKVAFMTDISEPNVGNYESRDLQTSFYQERVESS